MKRRPVLTPPIHKWHIGYFFMWFLANQGTKRFHRISIQSDFNRLTDNEDPVLLVSNHQNGMVDGMNISGVFFKQFSWLIRADVFWKSGVRRFLYGLNQLPIYRQRDKLTDLRERNNVIWNCCIARLEKGGSLALFPEGNHNPQKTIRGLKRGVSDLLGMAVTKNSDLSRIKLVPLGLDYENYPEYRNRLSLRVGKPIEWYDLYDNETGLVDFKQLNKRIQDELRELTVDIQPAQEYEILEPYVRALKTYEAEEEHWSIIKKELRRIMESGENSNWIEKVKMEYEALVEAGFRKENRPEAWGLKQANVRESKYWAIVLNPFSWIANIPTALQQYLLNRKCNKIKAVEFRSTFKIGAGMFIYPITWTVFAVAVGLACEVFDFCGFWYGFIGLWSWATFGNKFYGWLKGHIHDHKDAVVGSKFWSEEKSMTKRQAWENYIRAIKS
jgi:1-acyl-sn-glycerol-3-phosphate acyltransferase